MELLFLSDGIKSNLRRSLQNKLKVNDWIAMILGIGGSFIACIAVSIEFCKIKNLLL
jgi:hypothetical protein